MRSIPILLALALGAVPAAAEVLPVTWGQPAEARDVASVRGVALDRFGGSDGRALAALIETRLAAARDREGRDYYAVYSLAAPSAEGNVEIVFEGGASASIEERRSQQKRRYCKDAAEPRTNCEDKLKEEREVTCRMRIVALSSDLRAAREADGRVVYRRSLPLREEVTWCPGDAAMPASEDVVERLIDRAASDYAADFVPLWRADEIRVLENRRGLSKDQGERFKEALRATKTNAGEACRLFEELASEAPTQRSLAFNRALCAEMRGELDAALAGFEAMAGDREAAAAAGRVRGTMEAVLLEDSRT